MSRIARFALLVCLGLVAAGLALAHGPGIKMSRKGFDPAKLTVPVGQVVHFTCLEQVPRGLRVKADDDSFQSPRLARGEGFHHTFEKPGIHRFHLEQDPSVKGVVVVEAAAK